jgi:hypothetical protein
MKQNFQIISSARRINLFMESNLKDIYEEVRTTAFLQLPPFEYTSASSDTKLKKKHQQYFLPEISAVRKTKLNT